MGLLDILDILGIVDLRRKKIENWLRNYEIKNIVDMGENAVEVLMEYIDPEDHELGNRAIEALGKIGGEEAFQAVLSAIRHRVFLKSCVSALNRFNDARALPYLIPYLEDPDPEIRKNVIATVSKLKVLPDASEYIDDTELLSQPEKGEDISEDSQDIDNRDTALDKYIIVDKGHGAPSDVEEKLSLFKNISQFYGLKFKTVSTLDKRNISGAKIIVFATPTGDFTDEEVGILLKYLSDGGNILILATWNAGIDYTGINRVLSPIGIKLMDKLVCDYVDSESGRVATFSFDVEPVNDSILFSDIKKISFFKACAIDPGPAEVLMTAGIDSFADDNINMQPDEREDKGLIPVIVGGRYPDSEGGGKVLCVGDIATVTGNTPTSLMFVSNIIKWFINE